VWPEIITRPHDRQDCGVILLRLRQTRQAIFLKSLWSSHFKRYNGAPRDLSFEQHHFPGMQTIKIPVAMRERLLRSARQAMKNAYAPFSKFRVGSAVLTSRGQIFLGCNVENSSYGMTNCAERTAIFSAVAKDGPDLEIHAVAVVNDHGVACSPCGACRQVIYEFGPRAIVFYEGKNGPKQSLITELLPEGFRLK
jgi:cytidine deaminase